MPTFGSLFSGAGGLDLGLERAGWKLRWQAEIDECARAVLAAHWPKTSIWKDVRLVEGSSVVEGAVSVARVDLIVGGFPCQPFSRAGRRSGMADARWLWPEFDRVVRSLRPRYVLVENVPALLASDAMGRILGDLAESGYDCEWDCLPAAAFGAPHIRDRVYLLAYARERRPVPPGQTVFAGWTSSQLHAGWSPEPDVARVVDGSAAGVDRIRRRLLGQAVVPQVAEWIGRRLFEVSAHA